MNLSRTALARIIPLALLSIATGCAAAAPRYLATKAPLLAPAEPSSASMVEPIAVAEPVTALEPEPEPAVVEEPRAARVFHEPLVPRAETRAVVLLYHLFGADMKSAQSISPEGFEQQLTWLATHHVEIITAAELASFLDGALALPARVAVITLDDGHLSTFARAYPLLKKHAVRFTLALNTEAIEGHRPEAVTWDNVNAMLASGLGELASHSHIHGHMERLAEASNRREVTLSRSIIEARMGVRAETFVFPFGGHDQRVMGLVKEAGYRAAFAVGTGRVKLDSPRWELPRKGVLRSTTLSEIAVLFSS